jgi:hypothetical protein
VIQVDDDISDAELDDYHDAGVRGSDSTVWRRPIKTI